MSSETDPAAEPPMRSASVEILRSLHFGRASMHFWRAAGWVELEENVHYAGDDTDVDEVMQSDEDANTTEASGVKKEEPESATNAASIRPRTRPTLTSAPIPITSEMEAVMALAPRRGSLPPNHRPTLHSARWSPEAVLHVANLAAQAVRLNLAAKDMHSDMVEKLALQTAVYVAGPITEDYFGRDEDEITDMTERAESLASIPDFSILRNLAPANGSAVPTPNPAPHNDPTLALGPQSPLLQDALNIGDIARGMINAPRPTGLDVVRAIIHNSASSQIDKVDAHSIFDLEPRLSNDDLISYLKCVQQLAVWVRKDAEDFPDDPTFAARVQEVRLSEAHTLLALEH